MTLPSTATWRHPIPFWFGGCHRKSGRRCCGLSWHPKSCQKGGPERSVNVDTDCCRHWGKPLRLDMLWERTRRKKNGSRESSRSLQWHPRLGSDATGSKTLNYATRYKLAAAAGAVLGGVAAVKHNNAEIRARHCKRYDDMVAEIRRLGHRVHPLPTL